MRPSDVLSKRAKAYGTLVGDRELADDALLELMVQEPTLLRRPLAIKAGQAAIGFDKAGLTEMAGNA